MAVESYGGFEKGFMHALIIPGYNYFVNTTRIIF
jgi:hypothetical protein